MPRSGQATGLLGRLFKYIAETMIEHFLNGGQGYSSRWRTPLSTTRRVAIFLARLASNSTLYQVGMDHFCSGPSVHRSANECSRILTDKWMPVLVRWPSGPESKRVSAAFEARRGIPNVIGAIDGSHFPVKAPSNEPADYYNYKSFHSVIMLAVCDDKKRLLRQT